MRRFFQSEYVYKKILCHNIVHVNNQHIGRDDLQNYLLGLYPTELKGEKWYHRIFYHMFNCCCPLKKRIPTRWRWHSCTSATVQDCYTSGLRNRGKYGAAEKGVVVSHYCNQRKEDNANSHVRLFRYKLPWQDNRHSVCNRKKRCKMGQCNATSCVKYEKCQVQ